MTKIYKKTWPNYFELVKNGTKTFDFRLADFACSPSDTLVLQEYDPKTKQYTGRELEKEITSVIKQKDLEVWPKEEAEKHGYYILSFKDDESVLRKKHLAAGQAIQNAWQQRDASLLAPYLTDSLEWHEGVFESPLKAKQKVIDCWNAEVPSQTDIKVEIELLDFTDNRSYHRCKASWQDKRGKSQVNAIFVIHINDDGKITYFMPWYENAPKGDKL
jgi:hypothetical protein